MQGIPLRCAHETKRVLRPGSAGFLEDHLKVTSLAAPKDNLADALALEWNEIGIAHDPAGWVDSGQYVPADRLEDARRGFPGIHLAPNHSVIDAEQSVRHVHQDLVQTIRLKSEAETWVRQRRSRSRLHD